MQDVSVTVSPSIQEPEPFATVQLSSHTYLFIGMYIALFPLTVLLGLPRYTIFNKAYPFLQRSTVRPWIHHLPYKINILQFCTASAHPLAGTSRRVQRVQTGLGLGVQGQAELRLGVQGVQGR